MEEQARQQGDIQPGPEILYHYTDKNGLFGILENECIWATHYRFLNDISERQEAIRYCSNVISRRESSCLATGIGGQKKRKFLREVQGSLETEFQSVDAYVVCFTHCLLYTSRCV